MGLHFPAKNLKAKMIIAYAFPEMQLFKQKYLVLHYKAFPPPSPVRSLPSLYTP